MNARAVDERAVGAVEVLDGQEAVLEGNQGMLTRRPDALRRLLVLQVDIDRLFIGATDVIIPFVEGIFRIDALPAQDDQLRLAAGRQRRTRGGCRARGRM